MNDNEYFDIDELEPVESEESILAKAADRKRRRHREKRNREKRSREWQVRLQYAVVVAAGICLVALVSAVLAGRRKTSLTEKLILEEKQKREKTDKEEKERKEIEEEENELLSESVLQYRDLMEYYAEEEGIGEYVPVLLAIMEAETKGERDDVMQSSESAGLEPNTRIRSRRPAITSGDWSTARKISAAIRRASYRRITTGRDIFIMWRSTGASTLLTWRWNTRKRCREAGRPPIRTISRTTTGTGCTCTGICIT